MNDYDAIFSTVRFNEEPAGSICHRAIVLTTMKFDQGFPGWQIYHRLVSGDTLFDRSICAYFEDLALTLSRCRSKQGRHYVSRSIRQRDDWIRQAGRDAMDFVLFGRHFRHGEDQAEGLAKRAALFGVSNKTYQKVRDPVGIGVRIGMDRWISELHYQFSQLLTRQKYSGLELDV